MLLYYSSLLLNVITLLRGDNLGESWLIPTVTTKPVTLNTGIDTHQVKIITGLLFAPVSLYDVPESNILSLRQQALTALSQVVYIRYNLRTHMF